MHPIPYGRQQVTQEDIDRVVRVMQSDYLTQGPQLRQFEEEFARYVGARYAVGVANGTAALHVSTLSLGVRPGTRVICTPMTFAASSNCVLYAGGEVDFVDIDPQTGLMDIDALRQKLEGAPAGTYQGIIPVDYTGLPVRLDKIRALADAHGCWVLEDACHAPGGFFEDGSGTRHFCGNGKLADLAIFSFHPVKHIACGEGGMVTTDDEVLYQNLLLYRTHGITKREDMLTENHGGWYYEMHGLGFNYRLSELHAALGISQLERAAENLGSRKALAKVYDAAFAGTHVTPAYRPADGGHAYHLYVIRVPDRKGLYDYLRQHKIYSQVHYIPVHYLPYYQNLGWKKGDFPHTEAFYDQILSLPLFPSLREEEQAFVIEKVLEFVK